MNAEGAALAVQSGQASGVRKSLDGSWDLPGPYAGSSAPRSGPASEWVYIPYTKAPRLVFLGASLGTNGPRRSDADWVLVE